MKVSNSRLLFAGLVTLIAQSSLACPGGQDRCKEQLAKPIDYQREPLSPSEDGWEKYNGNPVFLGADSAGGGSPTCFVVRHFPWGYRMYYSYGGDYGHGFGLATSEDGINWTRYANNPVIVPDSGVVVWGPEVLHDGTKYHIWYVSSGMRQTGISHATSEDGISWFQSENNPVIDHGGCHAVIWDGQQYRIFIQYSAGRRHGFQLMTSPDGETWTLKGWAFYSGAVGQWDEITAAPSVAYYEDKLHLWYTGADTAGNRRGEIAIGQAVSDDWGTTFTIPAERTDLRMLRPTEQWEGRGLYSSGVDYDGERIFVWYASTGANGGFGYASRPVNAVTPPPTEGKHDVGFWSISPNPTAGAIRINHLGSLAAPAMIKLHDLSGRMVYSHQFAASEPLTLNPASHGLPVGKYFLQVEVGEKTVHKQFTLLR